MFHCTPGRSQRFLLQVLVVPVKVMAVAVVVAPARSEQPRHIWTNLHVAETDECAY